MDLYLCSFFGIAFLTSLLISNKFFHYLYNYNYKIDKNGVLTNTWDFYTHIYVYKWDIYVEISSCTPHVVNMLSVTVVELAQTDIPDCHTSYPSSLPSQPGVP